MDSTGKIGRRFGGLENDAVYVNKNTTDRAKDTVATKPENRLEQLKKALEGDNREDTVDLTVSQAIQAAFGEDSGARAKKIADLKSKIEKGEYNVDSRLVARELASEIAQSIYFDSDKVKKEEPLF